MSAGPDPYEILQVRTDAGEDVIRAAYRTLARRYHPDASIGDASSPQMVIVNWAWEILGDRERRSLYDRTHGILPRPASATQSVRPPATWSAPGGTGGTAVARARRAVVRARRAGPVALQGQAARSPAPPRPARAQGLGARPSSDGAQTAG